MDYRLRGKEKWWQMFISRISSGDKVLTADLDFDRGANGGGRRCSALRPTDIGSQVSTRTHMLGQEVK